MKPKAELMRDTHFQKRHLALFCVCYYRLQYD